jgi:hypothetical protein
MGFVSGYSAFQLGAIQKTSPETNYALPENLD